MTNLIITIIICIVVGLASSNNTESYNVEVITMQNVSNATQASARASTNPAIRNNSDHLNIDRTLRTLAENWYKIDVNGDWLHNCIDAAVLFYQYYPNKSNVRIVLNRNPKTEMNHLFNYVFTDGVWEAIEPQAYCNNHSNYLMRAVWGSKYDNTYNCDVTSEYIRYATK
jgi:hypothetical protein